jgi:hypothetical protein
VETDQRQVGVSELTLRIGSGRTDGRPGRGEGDEGGRVRTVARRAWSPESAQTARKIEGDEESKFLSHACS